MEVKSGIVISIIIVLRNAILVAPHVNCVLDSCMCILKRAWYVVSVCIELLIYSLMK